MKLISLNVGEPREQVFGERKEVTSIYKNPVDGKRKVTFLGIEGDSQSDHRSHGGPDKAIYSYDLEFYDHWKKVISRNDWVNGMFGENLTTEGLTDDVVAIGNVYRIGTAKLQAVQPRFPCQTLAARFRMKDMVQVFVEQKRHGTYFKVIEEGEIEVNDKIELIEESDSGITILDVTECKFSKGEDQDKLKKILDSNVIPDSLKHGYITYLK